MPSTTEHWRKHFESLSTNTLLLLIKASPIGHDEMLRARGNELINRILRERGVSKEELFKSVTEVVAEK